jgi:MoxR-like ATPase
VKTEPVRGERDPITKLDNNALFYGAPRTGKSVMSEKLAYEADAYPLVVIQGSSLTPKDLDYKSGIDPLGKFIFTLCDIDHTLVDDFGFEREENGEVRYILFVDEANQITTSTLISRSTELTFLKECMGSDDKKEESKNL